MMPTEIRAKISRVFLQPFVHNFKETVWIGTAEPMQGKYSFR